MAAGGNSKKRSPKMDAYYKGYKSRNKRAVNKLKKLKRHLSKFPKDRQARQSLALIETLKPGVKSKQVWRHVVVGTHTYRERIHAKT